LKNGWAGIRGAEASRSLRRDPTRAAPGRNERRGLSAASPRTYSSKKKWGRVRHATHPPGGCPARALSKRRKASADPHSASSGRAPGRTAGLAELAGLAGLAGRRVSGQRSERQLLAAGFSCLDPKLGTGASLWRNGRLSLPIFSVRIRPSRQADRAAGLGIGLNADFFDIEKFPVMTFKQAFFKSFGSGPPKAYR